MRIALDSNVLLYAAGVAKVAEDLAKGTLAQSIIDQVAQTSEIICPFQVFGECYQVLRRNGRPREDCRSIQTIMGHVVRAAYGYATYIYKHLGEDFDFRTTVLRPTNQAYCDDLDAAFQFNVTLFEKHPNLNLEELDNNKKILTRWGQIFDCDQLLEHAIVHILRHRRQIEKFKLLLK